LWKEEVNYVNKLTVVTVSNTTHLINPKFESKLKQINELLLFDNGLQDKILPKKM
jgi:hypothetical protein